MNNPIFQLTGHDDDGYKVQGNRYLWIRNYNHRGQPQDNDSYAEIASAHRIFDYMDMSDILDDPPELRVFLLRPDKAPLPCQLYGTWHNFNDPLRMEIRTNRGKVLDVGYGTDH